MIFDYVPTIRYMGTKSKLLNFIIPQILRITPENGSVADIMAGSMAVSYALKYLDKVWTRFEFRH